MKPILSFMDFLEQRTTFLTEFMPYFYNFRKQLQNLSSISKQSVEDGFVLLNTLSESGLQVYENVDTGSILAGITIEDKFYIACSVVCEERSLYVKSMQLSPKRKHVKLILTSTDFSRSSVARSLYIFLAKKFDLISDRIQYLGAKILWQSIAKDSPINVYVFDESIKDYLRDEQGRIILYNGSNIDDGDIWGTEDKHHSRLLVAVDRDLQ